MVVLHFKRFEQWQSERRSCHGCWVSSCDLW